MAAGQMTGAQARVVDPVLTNVARGYRNAALASTALFPIVEVGQRAGKVIAFGAEAFADYGDLVRVPGAQRPQIDVGYAADDYQCQQRALDGRVPVELLQEAAAVPGISMQITAIQTVMDVVLLRVERVAATLATTSANYDAANREALAGDDRWDNANASPAAKVAVAREQIATGIGRDPNVLVVGKPVHEALVNQADVIDRIKYTQGLSGDKSPIVTEAMLAQYFGVERYAVGRARMGEPGAFVPVWGKNAVLAYSELRDLASMGSPSFGYTYRLRGYPRVAPGWFDQDSDTWRYPMTTEDTPVIAGKAAGYLFTTVVG